MTEPITPGPEDATTDESTTRDPVVEPAGHAVLEPATDDDDLLPEKPRITARGAALVGVRVVAGAIGVGVAAATIAAATLLPLPTVSGAAPSALVTPVPTAQQLLCPGAFLRLADETGQGATSSSAIGRADVEHSASSGEARTTPLAISDATGSGGTGSAPTLVETPPGEAATTRVLVAGAQSQFLEGDEFAGLATATCAVATGDSWLVGGSTAVGRTTLLTLGNPTEVTATVDIELFGENGSVSAPGTRGIDVPPNGQRILSLAGFAPGLESPVIHVSSRGGRVVANLQQSIVRGIDPGGIDIVGASIAPSTELHIPGVVMTDHVAVEQLYSSEGSEDILTTVRLFLPGEEDATATVNLVPEDGAETGASFEVELQAGAVSDLPLVEIADGRYTITIESDLPIVASARVSSVGPRGTDFAWVVPAPELTGETLLSVPDGGAPSIHLSNPTENDLTVTLTGIGAPDVEVLVPAGSAATTSLEAGASYLASGFESLYASVTTTDDGFLATYTVQPPGVISTPIRVFP